MLAGGAQQQAPRRNSNITSCRRIAHHSGAARGGSMQQHAAWRLAKWRTVAQTPRRTRRSQRPRRLRLPLGSSSCALAGWKYCSAMPFTKSAVEESGLTRTRGEKSDQLSLAQLGASATRHRRDETRRSYSSQIRDALRCTAHLRRDDKR